MNKFTGKSILLKSKGPFGPTYTTVTMNRTESSVESPGHDYKTITWNGLLRGLRVKIEQRGENGEGEPELFLSPSEIRII